MANRENTLIEITPDEYQKILTRELSLPRGWKIGYEIPKPNGA